ncbi:MAG: SpoIID/LytB domain-containing protein [bacterium]
MLIFNLIFFIFFSFFNIYASGEFSYLYNASFTFNEGVPLIRVNAGEYSIPFSVKAEGKLECGSKKIAHKGSFSILLNNFEKETVHYRISLRELSRKELPAYSNIIKKLSEKSGLQLELFVHGGIFSIRGKKIDNRQYYLVLKQTFNVEKVSGIINKLRKKFPENNILSIPVMLKSAKWEIVIENGEKNVICKDILTFYPDKHFSIGKKTFPSAHNIYFIPRNNAKIALVVEEDIENIIPRILPGEMFASAPLETLKAQAVAARSDIFLQLGKRHTTDPWHICSEVHCQKVLWNNESINHRFHTATEKTKGMILLYNDKFVARAPYCSTSGGHTEDIRNVWFTAEVPYLKGVWDGEKDLELDLTVRKDIETFLKTDYGEDNIPLNKRHRWKKQIKNNDFQALLSGLGIGKIEKLIPEKRGVSGRIYVLTIKGSKGSKTVYGELNIRRLLDNMYSSLFIDSRKKNGDWVFRGAGWGHGVGMSQMGAISLGKKGKNFRFILKRYYPGTETTTLY